MSPHRTAYLSLGIAALLAGRLCAAAFEIVPFGGITLSGSTGLTNSPYDRLQIEPGGSYGVSLGYLVRQDGELDLSWTRQESIVRATGSGVPETTVAEHAGIDRIRLDGLYIGEYESIRPFVLFGLGATYFEPVGGFSGATKFNAALGTGFKYYLTKTWGLRVDARWTPTVLSSSGTIYCTGGGSGATCTALTSGQMLSQYEFTAGLVWRFGGEPPAHKADEEFE